jgi:hypothetical protein
VEREKQMRAIIVEYYRGEMKEGQHLYRLQEGRKPALAKEGALNLCSLFKVTPHYDEPVETFHGDHYTVRYRCQLIGNQSGVVAAEGEGLCTTREEKYSARWVWPSELPQGFDKTLLPSRTFKGKKGQPLTKYRVDNDNLPDTYNTILKMAKKRALVDAALQLPLVSELFTQDIEEKVADEGKRGEPEEPGEQEAAHQESQEMPAPTVAPGKPLPLKVQLNANINALGFQSADISVLQDLSEKVTGKRSRDDYHDGDYLAMLKVTRLMLDGKGLAEAVAEVVGKPEAPAQEPAVAE